MVLYYTLIDAGISKFDLPLDGFVFKPWHICRVTTLERKRWGLGLFL